MTTTPTKNESLPELPEYAASLHVQHFRNAPSMRNTDFVETNDFPPGCHRLYTADQMRAYAEAAITREAPTEGVLDRPARVAGRDFAAGQSTQQVIGRAQAHYEVHHEGCLRHPHTGELRDYRDVESDPDGTLCVGPGPLEAATPPAPQRLAQGEDKARERIERAKDACTELAKLLGDGQPQGDLLATINGQLGLALEAMRRTTQPPHHDRGEEVFNAFDNITGLCRYLREGGCGVDDLPGLEQGLQEAIHIAGEMLARLSEPTPKGSDDAKQRARELLAEAERGPMNDYGHVHRQVAHAAITAALTEAKQQWPGEAVRALVEVFRRRNGVTDAYQICADELEEAIAKDAPQVEAKRQTGEGE